MTTSKFPVYIWPNIPADCSPDTQHHWMYPISSERNSGVGTCKYCGMKRRDLTETYMGKPETDKRSLRDILLPGATPNKIEKEE